MLPRIGLSTDTEGVTFELGEPVRLAANAASLVTLASVLVMVHVDSYVELR